MNPNLIDALLQLERGKRMTRETVREILETALVTAARKSLGVSAERVIASYDEKTGSVRVLVRRTVAAGAPASPDEVSLADARKSRPDAAPGTELETQIPVEDLGRIAAQTAKHIVLQKVRELERESQYGEFAGKVGKVVTCVVKQRRGKLVILDLGEVEAVLPGGEQIPKEDYRPGEHLKVYVAEVSMTPRGPHIIASRNRPELVRFLFEQEVPEITQGIVEIKAIAREPGSRAKVAVMSHDRNVDPVGACIGMKGMRVQAVVQELHGEKMDIVMWAEDPEAFLMNSLSPAKPGRVVKNDDAMSMIAVAADHNQLTHLIGRGGQNARLASKLTGWKVEIMTEAELRGEKPAEPGAPDSAGPESTVDTVAAGTPDAQPESPANADPAPEALNPDAAPTDAAGTAGTPDATAAKAGEPEATS